jgi:alpha-N-arabinofuranosidase
VYGAADLVHSVATHDAGTGESAIFLVNRDQSQPTTVKVDVRDLGASKILERLTLSDDDVYAKNTLAEQNRVQLHENVTATINDSIVTITLPPVSWTAIALS